MDWCSLTVIVALCQNAVQMHPIPEAPAYIEDRLIGKSTFTKESLARYLHNMDRLTTIQESLFHLETSNGTFAERSAIPSTGEQRPEMNSYLFEGDIILNEEQMEIILQHAAHKLALQTQPNKTKAYSSSSSSEEEDKDDKRKKRTLTSNLSWRWTSFPIPFYINTNTGVDSGAVLAGVQTWMDNTCITFQQQSSLPSSGSALEFIQGQGCYSNIGRYAFGSQQISIGIGCTELGTVAHEIGHALGYYHEHTRFDRDSYVKILTQNIQSGYASQFTENPASAMVTFGVAYDLGSGFSANGGDTLQPIDMNFYNTVGQRVGLSFYDVKKINFAYCNNTCTTRLACQNGGYTDPKDCSQCRCPFGFGGTFCQQAAVTTTKNCGVLNLAASPTFQTLSMSGGGACNWIITAPAAHNVLIQFQSFSFSVTPPCYSDFLEIRYNTDVSNTGPRFCQTAPTGTLTSQSTLMVLLYQSQRGSFNLQYRYDPPDQLNTTTTTTTSTMTTTTSEGETTSTTTTTATTTTSTVPTTTQIGQWSSWTQWSACGASCGGCGTQSRWRTCSTNSCVGASTQTRYCNAFPCPGRFCCPPFVFVYPNFCAFPLPPSVPSDETKDNYLPPPWPWRNGTRPNKAPFGKWPYWYWIPSILGNDEGSGLDDGLLVMDEGSGMVEGSGTIDGKRMGQLSREMGLEIVSDAVSFRDKNNTNGTITVVPAITVVPEIQHDQYRQPQNLDEIVDPRKFYEPLIDDI